MFSSKSPSVFGLVSIRQAVSSPAFAAQVVEVDAALLVGGELHHLVAGHRHRRGVGAVRGVGGEHLGPVLAAVGVVGAGEQQARQLAVRSGRGLEADVRQAADLRQRLLEQPHQLEGALGPLRLLRRVQPRVARQRRHPLVEARVVLHRARAERVEARVEVEVPPRDPVVVPDDLGLRDLGQLRRLGAEELLRDQLVDRALLDSGLRQRRGAPALDRALVDRRRAVALHRRSRSRRHPLGDLGAAEIGDRPARARRRAGRCPACCAAR